MFKLNLKVDDIPETFCKEHEGEDSDVGLHEF